MPNPISIQVEIFGGAKGPHRSIFPVYNCSIQSKAIKTWGEETAWGPYFRQVHSVIMGDIAPLMIWVESYKPRAESPRLTAEVAWLDKYGAIQQGRLFPDGKWISDYSGIPGQNGLEFIREKLKEVLPNFLED